MQKVLHISNYYPPNIGGIEQTAYDIVNAFKGRFIQTVICFNHEPGEKDEMFDDVRVIRVGYFIKISSQAISFSYRKKLKEVIRDFDPDIIHFHYPNPLIAYFLVGIKSRAKLIIHWHADIIKQRILRIFFVGIHRKLIKRANAIIATSNNYIEGSKPLLKNREKCFVLPSAINFKRLELTEDNIQNAKKIKEKYKGFFLGFFVGRHVEYKGISYLIQAARFMPDNVRILIGGSGPLSTELKEQAKDNDKIIFLGRLKDDELKEYLYASDIFLFPSITKNEAFGLSLGEGLFYGKPAVTFTIPGSGVNFVNLNGVTGLEVPNRNVRAYADGIMILMYDKKLYKTLSENAHNRIYEILSPKAFSTKLNEIYSTVLEK